MSGRIRSIKPEILDDTVTARLSDMAFRIFTGAIVLADDYGRLRAEPGWLMGQIYWANLPRLDAFTKALAELAPLLRFYEVNGQSYAEIRNWSKHQKVDRPGKPRIPEPLPTSTETLATPSRESREALATDQGSGIRDQDHRPPTTDHAPPADGPGEVWSHYVSVLRAHRPRRRAPALSSKDRKKIRDYLRDGLTVDDLKRAIDGLFRSAHHLGQNDRATEYLELEYALRKPTQFAAIADGDHYDRVSEVTLAAPPEGVPCVPPEQLDSLFSTLGRRPA